jgi:hypothetical protein
MRTKNPMSVYDVLPREYMSSFHWINLPVTADKDSYANPLYSIVLDHFTPDDFVVIKLDIDMPAIEMGLIMQMIEDPRLHPLIDVLYFEHHTLLEELKDHWVNLVDGSIGYSLEVFNKLREAGVAVHYWI